MRTRDLLFALVLALPDGTSSAQAVVVGSGEKKPPAPAVRPSGRTASPEEADALASAAMKADLPAVQSLLGRGVDANAKGSLGKSPLRMATSYGCMMAQEKDVLPVVDTLIAAGADVNEVDAFGHGVLLMTAQKCKAAVVTRLLKAGADTEQRSPQGLSPLSMALIVENYDAAGALVDHGARLSRASMEKIFPEPPTAPEVAALVKRATAAK